jgi:hypothetical protein
VICKVCGRPDLGRGLKLIPFTFTTSMAIVIEALCWTCVYWLKFGKTWAARA